MCHIMHFKIWNDILFLIHDNFNLIFILDVLFQFFNLILV